MIALFDQPYRDGTRLDAQQLQTLPADHSGQSRFPLLELPGNLAERPQFINGSRRLFDPSPSLYRATFDQATWDSLLGEDTFPLADYFGIEFSENLVATPLEVDMAKFVNFNRTAGPDEPNVPRLALGESVNWIYEVANMGETPIPACDLIVTDSDPALSPTLNPASDDGDMILSPLGSLGVHGKLSCAEPLRSARWRDRRSWLLRWTEHLSKHLGHVILLAFLAPDIVAAILSGSQPVGLTAEALVKRTRLPHAWGEQKAVLGFE